MGKLNRWKIDICASCGKKKMLKEDCVLCGVELCDKCVCGNTGCCPQCAKHEVNN